MQHYITPEIIAFITGVGVGVGIIIALLIFIGRRGLRLIDCIPEILTRLSVVENTCKIRHKEDE